MKNARRGAGRGSGGGYGEHPVAVEEGGPPFHERSPLHEVLLVVDSVTLFVGVLEFVEGGVFRIEQFAVTPEESLVDHTRFTHA
jgi:hypothetical protein